MTSTTASRKSSDSGRKQNSPVSSLRNSWKSVFGSSPTTNSPTRSPIGSTPAVQRYESDFITNRDVGLLHIEVASASHLPKLKNFLVRDGWDNDPFVVVTFDDQTFRTQVIEHNLNPVWHANLSFQVLKKHIQSSNAHIHFSILDHDQHATNDPIGTAILDLSKVLNDVNVPRPDKDTGLYPDGGEIVKTLKVFSLPIKPAKGATASRKGDPFLTVRAKFQPSDAQRQRYWREQLQQADSNHSKKVSRREVMNLTFSLNVHLDNDDVDRFFKQRGAINATDELTTDEIVAYLENTVGGMNIPYPKPTVPFLLPHPWSPPTVPLSPELSPTSMPEPHGEPHGPEEPIVPVIQEPRPAPRSLPAPTSGPEPRGETHDPKVPIISVTEPHPAPGSLSLPSLPIPSPVLELKGIPMPAPPVPSLPALPPLGLDITIPTSSSEVKGGDVPVRQPEIPKEPAGGSEPSPVSDPPVRLPSPPLDEKGHESSGNDPEPVPKGESHNSEEPIHPVTEEPHPDPTSSSSPSVKGEESPVQQPVLESKGDPEPASSAPGIPHPPSPTLPSSDVEGGDIPVRQPEIPKEPVRDSEPNPVSNPPVRLPSPPLDENDRERSKNDPEPEPQGESYNPEEPIHPVTEESHPALTSPSSPSTKGEGSSVQQPVLESKGDPEPASPAPGLPSLPHPELNNTVPPVSEDPYSPSPTLPSSDVEGGEVPVQQPAIPEESVRSLEPNPVSDPPARLPSLPLDEKGRESTGNDPEPELQGESHNPKEPIHPVTEEPLPDPTSSSPPSVEGGAPVQQPVPHPWSPPPATPLSLILPPTSARPIIVEDEPSTEERPGKNLSQSTDSLPEVKESPSENGGNASQPEPQDESHDREEPILPVTEEPHPDPTRLSSPPVEGEGSPVQQPVLESKEDPEPASPAPRLPSLPHPDLNNTVPSVSEGSHSPSPTLASSDVGEEVPVQQPEIPKEPVRSLEPNPVSDPPVHLPSPPLDEKGRDSSVNYPEPEPNGESHDPKEPILPVTEQPHPDPIRSSSPSVKGEEFPVQQPVLESKGDPEPASPAPGLPALPHPELNKTIPPVSEDPHSLFPTPSSSNVEGGGGPVQQPEIPKQPVQGPEPSSVSPSPVRLPVAGRKLPYPGHPKAPVKVATPPTGSSGTPGPIVSTPRDQPGEPKIGPKVDPSKTTDSTAGTNTDPTKTEPTKTSTVTKDPPKQTRRYRVIVQLQTTSEQGVAQITELPLSQWIDNNSTE